MYIKVIRRNRHDCIVMLGKDRTTEKCSLVELSPEQVFMGIFDSIEDAIANIMSRMDVVCFSLINDPFAPPKTANAINYKLPAFDSTVYRAMIEQSLKDVEEMDNRLSNLICKGFK